MTAEVIELRPGLAKLPPDPESRRERAKDALSDAWVAVRGWCAKSPIIIMRRREFRQKYITAFELGRESMRLALRD